VLKARLGRLRLTDIDGGANSAPSSTTGTTRPNAYNMPDTLEGAAHCATHQRLRPVLNMGRIGQAGVYLERFVEHARHIEVQISATACGGVMALGSATVPCNGAIRR